MYFSSITKLIWKFKLQIQNHANNTTVDKLEEIFRNFHYGAMVIHGRYRNIVHLRHQSFLKKTLDDK